MIQRIQTVYLAIMVFAITIMYTLPLFVFSTVDEAWQLYVHKIITLGGTPPPFQVFPMAILPVFTAVLGVMAIMSFKNRPRQIKLSKLANWALVTLVLVIIIYTLKLSQYAQAASTPQWALVFPIVALTANILAVRAIKHDEKLVRSADRLR